MKKNQFEKKSKFFLCQLDLTNSWLGMRDQDNPTLKKIQSLMPNNLISNAEIKNNQL